MKLCLLIALLAPFSSFAAAPYARNYFSTNADATVVVNSNQFSYDFTAGLSAVSGMKLTNTSSYGTNTWGAGGAIKASLPFSLWDTSFINHWEFSAAGAPVSNTVARFSNLTNIVRTATVQTLNSNAVLTIDCSEAAAPLQLCRTEPNYNLTIVVTNLAAGRSVEFSILGPSGSNAVTWVWEPWVRAQWPTDPYSDLPITNTYIRSGNYLDVSLLCYATNQTRIRAGYSK